MHYKFHNRQKGFTLIELMMVIVIIGILAALAIPRFMIHTTKSKQSEAKGILKQIYTMERTYMQEKNTYFACANNADFLTIGVEIPVGARYTYLVDADATTFTATATVASPGLDDDAAQDEWQIIQTGDLTCNFDDAILVN
jgi:prepilin-type N-terminal cleavage/methylation domain-containing protein